MRDKFGLEFRIVDTELVKQLRRERGIHVNPWTHFPRLITSIDFLKRERPLRLFRDVLPPTADLPAHVRPADRRRGPQRRARPVVASTPTDSQRPRRSGPRPALRAQAVPDRHAAQRLPGELHGAARAARQPAVRPQRASRPRSSSRRVMVRRLKSDLVDCEGQPRSRSASSKPLEVDYTDEEREVHAAPRASTSRARDRSRPQREGERSRPSSCSRCSRSGCSRRPRRSRRTLAQAPRHHRGASDEARRRCGSIERILRRAIARDRGGLRRRRRCDEAAETEAVDSGRAVGCELSSRRERAPRASCASWARAARAAGRLEGRSADRAGSKTTSGPSGAVDRRAGHHLHRVPRHAELAARAPRQPRPRRRATALMLMYGGMDHEQRETIKAAFQADPERVAGPHPARDRRRREGIDLQNHCYRSIHFEIPWNPNRWSSATAASTATASSRPRCSSTTSSAKDYRREQAEPTPGSATSRATWSS